MKDSEKWQAGKFVYRKGKLVASRNLEEVGLASRLIAGIVAARYDTNLRKHARGRLLDLGCGKVPLYEAYKDLVTDNVCVDWPNCLHENRHVDHKCDLNQELHFESGEFDTIILSDVLEHIREPALLWSEMSRVLSEGGKILMNVPFYYWLHEQPHDYYRYTEFALQRFVEMSGLRLVVLEPIGGAPEVVVDVFSKTILDTPILGRPLAALAQQVCMVFLRTRLGSRVSSRTSRTFPLGYFLVAEKAKTSATVAS